MERCMRFFKIFGIIMTVFFLLSAAFATAKSDILPADVVVAEGFKPGYGQTVGTILLVQGPVMVAHDNMQEAYRAKKGLPLYKGDTVYTEKRGRVRFKLNDGSIMTLSSNSKLKITKSVFNPQKKQRSSFLSMTVGKARFWVSKLLAFKDRSFKVKTSTFVAGVRGSDFIITATPQHTEVLTLTDTSLEVVSLAAPELAPTILSDFQKTSVEMGGVPQEPVAIPSEEIETLTQGLAVTGGFGKAPLPTEKEMSSGKSGGTADQDAGEKAESEETPADQAEPSPSGEEPSAEEQPESPNASDEETDAAGDSTELSGDEEKDSEPADAAPPPVQEGDALPAETEGEPEGQPPPVMSEDGAPIDQGEPLEPGIAMSDEPIPTLIIAPEEIPTPEFSIEGPEGESFLPPEIIAPEEDPFPEPPPELPPDIPEDVAPLPGMPGAPQL